MKKFNVHYCASSINYYAVYAKREYCYAYSDSYDPDNYAYCDSRESVERYLSRGSLESLL
jgi:hypothetical protein